MSIFKCKMCGGTLEINDHQTTAICEYCQTQQTLPKLDDDRRANLYDRANHFRRNNEFDKAMSIYETILNEDSSDAEAYWSLVLCRYGIEYVEDPTTRKRIPTVNRAQFTSIFDDDNYKSALQYADGYQKSIYEQEATAINEIQKGILAISQKEEPFDVFICYKETDQNGRRTQDSVLANDLYHQLTAEGFKVFFSRITLEDKLGVAYEPYIFAALNSAKVMVVLGTKPEYFNAVWVKNEWSRYLTLVKQSGGKKVLIPAYRDMDPYDLPEEFSHLQAQDMSKLGFMQDLIRGIKKLVQDNTPKATAKETVIVSSGNANTTPLLKRAFMYLEDGEWHSADEYCEKVLDQDPENALAYLGKLMAELHVRKQDALRDQAKPFDSHNNYQKALRFADDKLKVALTGYIEHINTRNENARLEGIYSNAKSKMTFAKTEGAYKQAASQFETIGDYRDSATLARECYEKAEVARKDGILSDAKSKMTGTVISNYESAIKLFESISGWKDADEQIYNCKKKIEELKAKAEADRLERERKAEIARVEAEKRAKRNKKIAIITTPIVCAVIAFIVVLNTVIIPNAKYNDAVALMNDGKYTEAIDAFTALDGYKDSNTQIQNCETAIMGGKYNDAVALMNKGKYTEAIDAFTALDGYKDSNTQIQNCETAIMDGKYNDAVALMNAGKYEEAIAAFTALDGYKDSESQIQNCKYNDAVALMNEGKVVEAYETLIALDGYKDSDEKAKELHEQYPLECCAIGDYITFGTYEQDNNTTNGNENIEWLVLDRKDGKALVISKYALDCQQYNTSYTSVTWETCTLRNWLNDDFINTAFSDAEQSCIPTVTVSADRNPEYDTNPGSATKDKVFLLSITEVNKYFGSDSARECEATAYAEAQGADNGNCWWWLRSPGRDRNLAAGVNRGGDVGEYGSFVGYHRTEDGYIFYGSNAVRPALWIDLNS